jgi:hypothetical protein
MIFENIGFVYKMNIKKIILISILLTLSSTLYSQDKIALNKLEDRLDIGIYIDNVYNIDYVNSTYEVIFYLWSNSYNEIYEIDKNILDIDKSIDLELVFKETDSIVVPNQGKKFKNLVKYKAKMLYQTDMSKYPFDKMNLNLNVELLGHHKGDKNIHIDKKNSLIKPNFIDKWHLDTADLKIISVKWLSNFGELKTNDAALDTLSTSIILSRDSWNLYWKMFLVLFISFFISSLNLFLPNKLSEEKFALIVGSLFTAIGNKYISESYLPFSDKLNLSDFLHIITFLFISFYTLFAIYEQRTRKLDSLKSDFLCFFTTISFYVIIVVSTTFYFIK